MELVVNMSCCKQRSCLGSHVQVHRGLVHRGFKTVLKHMTSAVCREIPQDKLTWALPRADGCGRYSLPVFADGTREARASAYLAGTETYRSHQT